MDRSGGGIFWYRNLPLTDFLTALALVFVIEGLLYAAAPHSMRDMAVRITNMEPATLRRLGLGVASITVAYFMKF